MKFFDAFSGIGGFHEGITQAHPDWECVGCSEIDKYASSVYAKHFPKVKNYGDITKMDRLPEGTELFCGGFPCQSFSIAGKRRGFEDTRGTLFFDIARLCEVSKPKIIFLENVKGLTNHDNGRTIRTIIRTLVELDYCVEGQILNSKNFGVPQNRERVFIIGHLGGEPERKVFPLRSTDCIPPATEQGTETSLQSSTITGRYGTGQCNGETYIQQINEPNHAGDRVYCADGISPSLRARAREDATSSPKIVQPVLTPDRLEKRQNGRRFKEDGEPSFSLTAQDKHGVYLDKKRIRRLTPLEAERLQGFSDGWTEWGKKDENTNIQISDSQRYKMLGNAVTVPVIKTIAENL